jgi:hypothetical protein
MRFTIDNDLIPRQFPEPRFFKVSGPHQKVAVILQDRKDIPPFLLIQRQGDDDSFIGLGREG